MHLCSLHGLVDRFAFSVIFNLDENNMTDIKSVWFGKTVIKNCAALTYEQAECILLGDNPNDIATAEKMCAGGVVDAHLLANESLKNQLVLLTKLGRQRKAMREELGALELRSNELKFKLDQDGNPSQVQGKKEREIHNTVAELMIMANECVAKQIHKNYPASSLLRVHSAVSGDKFDELEELYKATGLTLSCGTNKDLADSLKRSKRKERDAVQSLLSSITTRAMNEAAYICTGVSSVGHYGLGLNFYTHFTSPIRRYADIVVHRLLFASIRHHQVCPYTTGETSSVCNRLNYQNRKAKLCSMDSQKLFLSLYFQTHMDVTEGVIVGLRQNGFLLYVPKYDLKGPVYVRDKDENIQIDPSLVGISPEAGQPASYGFSVNESCRKFIDGHCILHDDEDGKKKRLELHIPHAPKVCIFKVLDVVKVQISCDSNESRARVPQIALHLVSPDKTSIPCQSDDSDRLSINQLSPTATYQRFSGNDINPINDSAQSMYKILSEMEIVPNLPKSRQNKESEKCKNTREQIFQGRYQFKNFRPRKNSNDEENNRQQSVVISSMSTMSGYDSQNIEKDVTSRMQRLAAGKRNARISKAKAKR